MIFEVSHRTTYAYSQPVVQSQHLIHMSPRVSPHQFTRHHSLIIEPAPAMRFDGVDAFANPVTILDVEAPHQEFILHARSTIEVLPPPTAVFSRSTAWDALDDSLFAADQPANLDIVQFRSQSRQTTASLEIADYAAQSFAAGRPVLEAAEDLTYRIFKEFTFDPAATDISTPVTQVFRERRGVCQDFAHFALACLRALRVPAKYMSGYILTHPPPGQPKLQGADASHAWISVWSPETGWCGFDPTNGLVVADEHIIIAEGRDYNDVCPISGVLLGGGEHTVLVAVEVAVAGS
jgi:transglutaminase-like putative cysteine protease